MDPITFLRPDLNRLEKYVPIKPLDVLAEEIRVKTENLVKLDANENLYGPIPEIRAAIAASDLHIYPDPSQTYLRKALSQYVGTSFENIIAGTGSDDIIDIVMRTVDPLNVIICSPTFGMYSFLGKINKSNIMDVGRTKAPEFDVDIEALRAAVSTLTAPSRAIIFLASPNNPTGRALSHEQVINLCQMGPMVVIDEAYAEFCEPGWISAIPLVEKYSNLVVLRTFSKWAALAGMRVGFGVAAVPLVEWMMAIKQPYNVSVTADVAARCALANINKVMHTVNLIKEEKIRLFQELSNFSWLEPISSSANFFLVKVNGVLTASQVVSSLRKSGILVRYFTNPLLVSFFRVSVGRPSDTDAFISHLRQLEKNVLHVYEPQAWLWDMDGVLADVSQSYRQAIIRTAATFGVEVTNNDIVEAKMAGNANNDWILTHRLIRKFTKATKDTIPTLEEVTGKFEDLYQGELRFLEKLLVPLETLEKFHKLFPMAVVTGRPRSDAVKFLETHRISQFFQHLVCMEDAPGKPDPAPVHLALQKLGVGRAILIGDTPDDVRAAVAAGIVGVGILSPGEKAGTRAEAVKQALLANGASIVVESVSELLFLPQLPSL